MYCISNEAVFVTTNQYKPCIGISCALLSGIASCWTKVVTKVATEWTKEATEWTKVATEWTKVATEWTKWAT